MCTNEISDPRQSLEDVKRKKEEEKEGGERVSSLPAAANERHRGEGRVETI